MIHNKNSINKSNPYHYIKTINIKNICPKYSYQRYFGQKRTPLDKKTEQLKVQSNSITITCHK